jgi:hypothetical protein
MMAGAALFAPFAKGAGFGAEHDFEEVVDRTKTRTLENHKGAAPTPRFRAPIGRSGSKIRENT